MEAKDIKRKRWCPQHGYPLPCHKCGMPLSQTDQKEIYDAGYNKALAQLAAMTAECEQRGTKKVVEWIEKEFGYFTDDGLAKIIVDDGGYYGRPNSIAKWQQIKKSWNL